MREGNKHREVRHTELNQHSSRSHTILQLIIEQQKVPKNSLKQGEVIKSKINFVDLAGSERWPLDHDLADERINEMNFINSSLSSLACVVSALSEKSQHIPYRQVAKTALDLFSIVFSLSQEYWDCMVASR